MEAYPYIPFFSVIIPIYNRASFVNSGINLLLNQSFKDYEIILIDDGSTDGTAKLCDEVATHEKITVIHKKNEGVGLARNVGLDKTCGEYVCFFDIDDCVSADWLERIYYHLENKDWELLIYGYRELNPICGTSTDFSFDDKNLETNNELREMYSECLSGMAFNNGYVWNKVYKRDFLFHNNIRFPNLRIQQDEVFNHYVYRKATRVKVISEILYDYYVYNEGTGRSAIVPNRIKIFKAVRASFLNLYDFWKLDDKKLLTYIHRRFVYNMLYNKNKTGLKGVRKYANEVFSLKEVEESIAYIDSNDTLSVQSIDKLYRIAIKRKSKILFLLAEIRDRAVGNTKALYRRLMPRKRFVKGIGNFADEKKNINQYPLS